MVAEVRHVRNADQQRVPNAVSGSKEKVDTTIRFDRASFAVGDAQFEVKLCLVDHIVC